jgi:hypothetical protein
VEVAVSVGIVVKSCPSPRYDGEDEDERDKHSGRVEALVILATPCITSRSRSRGPFDQQSSSGWAKPEVEKDRWEQRTRTYSVC